MSKRYNDGSHWENHQRAAEIHEAAAHAHLAAAEHRGEQDHLTGHEQSRQALEHSRLAHEHSAKTQHGASTFGHAEIEARAHQIWISKGRPQGSAEADWFQAAAELRAHSS
jgi:mannosyltransferase OCH1-like enzyme